MTSIWRSMAFAACACMFLSAAGDASAQQTDNFPFSGLTLDLREYVNPPAGSLISMTTRPDAPELHVSAQSGQVFRIDEDLLGNTSSNVFFDYNTEINEEFGGGSGLNLGGGGAHGGLRAVAFHPEFAANGKLYTAAMVQHNNGMNNYLGNDSFQSGSRPDSLVAEWTYDPNTNDFTGYRELFRVVMPVFDHPLKQMKFNPFSQPGDADYGLLYIAHGDGSDQPASRGGGQNGDDALGKILRINPMQGPADEPYTIVNSPFAGDPSVLDEVYSMGHRNPHNISFALDDQGNSHILNGDIGRNEREEINLILAGANNGWSQREGTLVHNPANSQTSPLPANEAQNGYTFPVAQYDHSISGGGNAIAMGHVIQNGSDPALQNQLIFGDFASAGQVFHADFDDILNAVIQLDPNDPDRDHPSELTNAPVFRARLALDHDNDVTTPPQMFDTFNAMLGTSRNDMRFGRGPDGEMYISTKQSGGRVFLVTNSLGTSGDLKLTVDRDTNQIMITNPNGVDIDVNEYTLTSVSSSLNSDAWSSLQSQGLTGWQVDVETNQQLRELNDSSSSTVGESSPLNLGDAYQVGDVPFGVKPPSDILFTYATIDGESFVGSVEYIGEGLANNLVLNIDPTSGAAQLLNESAFHIELDGLSIASASGWLDGAWTTDQSDLAEDWVLSNPTDQLLGLLNPDSVAELAGGETLDLGVLFTGGDSPEEQDLKLSFLLVGENDGVPGVVRFNGFAIESGDFNLDGQVDGADFTIWQRQFGLSGDLAADGNHDGQVDESDLAIWQDQFGTSPSSSRPTAETIPEPATILLATLCLAAGPWVWRRPR